MKVRYSRAVSFILVVVLLFFLRSVDLFVTFLYTPSLNQEINPLVSVLEMGWEEFILTQAIIIILICASSAYYIWGRSHAVETKNLAYSDFIYYYFYDKLEPWYKRFFKIPKNIFRHFRLLSYVITLVTILISFLAIFHNILLLFNVGVYIEFVNLYFFKIAVLVTIFLIFVSVNMFFIGEYKHYKNNGKN